MKHSHRVKHIAADLLTSQYTHSHLPHPVYSKASLSHPLTPVIKHPPFSHPHLLKHSSLSCTGLITTRLQLPTSSFLFLMHTEGAMILSSHFFLPKFGGSKNLKCSKFFHPTSLGIQCIPTKPLCCEL